MRNSETIIELGAEGASIRLCGNRTERGWIFFRRLNDWTPDLIEEEHIRNSSLPVDSWQATLGLLDQYPWHRLVPLVIHPEFKDRILVAVKQRLREDAENSEQDFERWLNCL